MKWQVERCKDCGKWRIIEIIEEKDLPIPSDMNQVIDKRCKCEEPLKG